MMTLHIFLGATDAAVKERAEALEKDLKKQTEVVMIMSTPSGTFTRLFPIQTTKATIG